MHIKFRFGKRENIVDMTEDYAPESDIMKRKSAYMR